MSNIWGRPTAGGESLIAYRKTQQSPVEPRFVSMNDAAGNPITESAVTYFEHRDQRIWQAETISLPRSHALRVGQCKFLTRIRTAGVVPIKLLSQQLSHAKRTVERFANMPLDSYEVLVADAVPTLDNPQQGPEVSVEITYPQPNNRPIPSWENQPEPPIPTIRRGRLVGSRINLYPSYAEVEVVLGTITERHVWTVNEIVEKYDLPRHHGTFDRGNQREGYQERRVIDFARDTEPVRQINQMSPSLDEILYPSNNGREERCIQL